MLICVGGFALHRCEAEDLQAVGSEAQAKGSQRGEAEEVHCVRELVYGTEGRALGDARSGEEFGG